MYHSPELELLTIVQTCPFVFLQACCARGARCSQASASATLEGCMLRALPTLGLQYGRRAVTRRHTRSFAIGPLMKGSAMTNDDQVQNVDCVCSHLKRLADIERGVNCAETDVRPCHCVQAPHSTTLALSRAVRAQQVRLARAEAARGRAACATRARHQRRCTWISLTHIDSARQGVQRRHNR